MGFIICTIILAFVLYVFTRVNPIFLGLVSLLMMSVVDMASWCMFGVGW